MSRFYANIEGNRGGATRQGTLASGIYSHTRGWDVGCRVSMHVGDNGEDVCDIYLTAGSNGNSSGRYLGSFRHEDLKKEIKVIKE
jgi:hypothetical protein